MLKIYYKIRPVIVGILTFYLFLIVSGVSAEGTASLYLWPASGSFSQDFNVEVMVSSQDEEMNSTSGTLHFPTDKLNVVSLSTSGSIIDTWISGPTFSNGSGQISYGGITLNNGPFKGSSGKVLTIKFRPISSGDAEVRFSAASVLANDLIGSEMLIGAGKGTYSLTANGQPIPDAVQPTAPIVSDEPVVQPTPAPEEVSDVVIEEIPQNVILRPAVVSPQDEGGVSGQGAESVVEDAPSVVSEVEFGSEVIPAVSEAVVEPEPVTKAVNSMSEIEKAELAKLLPERPMVNSPTHPDSEKAYSNNNPTFTWSITNDIVGVNFLADRNPVTYLNEKSHGLMTSYTYTDVEDGEWYFHIRLQNKSGWGNTTHRKFIIDTNITDDEGLGGEFGDQNDGFLYEEDITDDMVLKGASSGDEDLEELVIAPVRAKENVWLKWEYLKNMPLTYVLIVLLLIVVIAESIILAGVLLKGKDKKKKKKRR